MKKITHHVDYTVGQRLLYFESDFEEEKAFPFIISLYNEKFIGILMTVKRGDYNNLLAFYEVQYK